MAWRSDRAVWKGQRPWVEMWFAVVVDADRRRAAWIRQTLFVPKQPDAPGRATVWAAWFDGADIRAAKHFIPIEQATIGDGDELIRIDDCRIERNGAIGQLDGMTWNLAWTGGRAAGPEMPSWLPAPTHARQIAHDADATGSVTVDGVAQPLRGKAVAMHLWGKRRVPTLHWIWAPWLGHGSLEVTAVSLRDRFALGMSSLRLEGTSDSEVRGRPATSAHPHGLVTATIAGPRRLVHARAWAEPSAMVGYAYRDTDDRDLMIAQSDVGSAHFEVFTRSAPGVPWKPVDERRCVGGVAVEIHQRTPLPEVRYIGWNDTKQPPVEPVTDTAPGPRVAWPELGSIVAFGLMYRDHAKETGQEIDPEKPPYCFTKHPRSFAIGSGPVEVPTSDALVAALEAIEPGVRTELTRLAMWPAVMDYEGELALVALGDIDGDKLHVGVAQPFGLAAANDLTARICQVLGENTERAMEFWACAKSFPRFLPVASDVYAPPGGLATIPELMIETRVNGEQRQHTSTSELSYGLSTIVRTAAAHIGRPLRRGDVILTGTPAGVGLRLSPLKRKIAELVKDRFRKAELLVASYATSTALLRPGDVIEVDAGIAGRVRTRLTV